MMKKPTRIDMQYDKRVTILIEVEVDLDFFPGFGHEPSSWCKRFSELLVTDHHYNPVVVSCKEK